ncbi:MAG TPA: stage III sporulation protein AA [Firmicutes bacterium]|nr:stage III sporulation protein AA [Bacillota bacterium]
MHSSLEEVLNYFPPVLKDALAALPPSVQNRLEEVRLRRGRPAAAVSGGREFFLGPSGVARTPEGAISCSEPLMSAFLEAVSRASLYAYAEQVRRGYITLPGGHRLGLAGEAVLSGGEVRTIKHIGGFNLRLAREIKGAADKILPGLLAEGRLCHTLIVSPPGSGKTTLLRDLARQISNGVEALGLPGCKVAIADERSEIAACYRGEPQLDVGRRTDVLDGCPKAEAIMMLIRAMSPEVLITDEIGSEADGRALEEALHCGITLVVTAHGASGEDICRRPVIERLVRSGGLERLVFLSRRRGPGTLEGVFTLSKAAGGHNIRPMPAISAAITAVGGSRV